MKDYICEIPQIGDQLTEMGIKFEKLAIVGFILNGLPEDYWYLVVNLESHVQMIGYEDLLARLMDEEKHIRGNVDLNGTRTDTDGLDIMKTHAAKVRW